jgi:hypothetical protein
MRRCCAVRAVLCVPSKETLSMHRPHRFVFASIAAAAAILSSSAAARADALPPDACTQGMVGQACSNAGPMYDEPGICTAEMCPRHEGGTTPCYLCEPTDAGVTDAGKDGSSSSGSSSGGSSGSSSGASSGSSSGGESGGSSGGGSGSSSGGSEGGGGGKSGGGGGGCALSPLARDGTAGLAMLALALGALTLARRRRDP